MLPVKDAAVGVLTVLLCLGGIYREANGQEKGDVPTNRQLPGVLDGLDIEECVHILNDRTSARIYLETTGPKLDPVYKLTLASLVSNSVDQVIGSLLAQHKEYVAQKSGQIFNILPATKEHDDSYAFNKSTPQFEVDDKDLIGMMMAVFERFKEPYLNLDHPFVLDGSTTPVWANDLPKAGKRASLHLRDANLRSVLNEISKSQEMYWVAAPFGPVVWTNASTGEVHRHPGGVGIQMFSMKERRSAEVIRKHSPEWRDWLKHELENSGAGNKN